MYSFLDLVPAGEPVHLLGKIRAAHSPQSQCCASFWNSYYGQGDACTGVVVRVCLKLVACCTIPDFDAQSQILMHSRCFEGDSSVEVNRSSVVRLIIERMVQMIVTSIQKMIIKRMLEKNINVMVEVIIERMWEVIINVMVEVIRE